MADNYKINQVAKDDLKRIYEYGFHNYGEAKADEYYQTFFDRFEQLVGKPCLYQTVDHIREGYRRSVCGADSIYYRINGDTIEIMRILGQQNMDKSI